MVRFSVEKDRLICTFSGRVDTENCIAHENEVYEKVKTTKLPVVFDLAAVDYVSSMFLRICMWVLKEAGGERFSITNLTPNVKKVFKVAGLDNLIAIS